MPAPAPDTASILSQSSSREGKSAFAGRGPGFTLETFSSKDFIVKDFIESLSEAAVPASRRPSTTSHTQAFDPKPLIRAFEHALSRLNNLSEDLESRENELSGAVRRAEAQHSQSVETLGRKLEQAVDSFHQLDNSLNGGDSGDVDAGGNIAVRIGERLEELDRQRQRAQDVKFLIQCWMEVSDRGNLSSLEEVRKMGGGEGKVRCAHIARQLLKLSQRLNPENGVNGVSNANGSGPTKFPTREIIEKFLEGLEKDLLKQFDDSYRKQNFEAMKECALALRDFGDGASVMGLFVNQHQFFIDRSQLITEELAIDSETWERLADPDADPPGVEPSLQSLADEVRLVVQEESFIIKRAFPYYEEVLIRFLQRIFQQSVQQRLEMVLEKANSISSLSFLRSLQSSRSYLSSLVEDLKSHGLTEHPEPTSSQVSATLDQQLEELFVPYFVGSSYIEREKRNLEELYSSLLFKFTAYHARRKKLPTTYLASLGQRGKELMASARDAYLERLGSTELPASQKAMLLRLAGIQEEDTEKKEIEVSEEDGALSLPHAKRMLKWLAEGVGRGLELGGGHETPKDVQALLNLLLSHMGQMYLESALDAASDQAAAQENVKNNPDMSYLPSLKAAISILHLLETSITTVLLPLASSNLTIRREIEKATTLTLTTLETKISSILQRTLDATFAWITRVLSNQKKTDFRPKDDDAMAVALATETQTCAAITQFLVRVASQASLALDGRNLSLFLAELALGLRFQLLDHLKRFSVSLTGGLVVSKDVTKYVEMVRDWSTGEELEPEAMNILVDVANLFVIGPEALKERLRNATTQEAVELRTYVLRREDAGSVGVQSALAAV